MKVEVGTHVEVIEGVGQQRFGEGFFGTVTNVTRYSPRLTMCDVRTDDGRAVACSIHKLMPWKYVPTPLPMRDPVREAVDLRFERCRASGWTVPL